MGSSINNYFSVLKNFNFTKLWISQTTSQLTNYILSFAILIKAFKLTNSSVSVALIIMAFGAATLFFGSLAGVYADRFDRKWLLTIVNFLQAASIGLYFIIGGEFWALLLITFLYSSLNQFYIPAEAPSIPMLVEPSQVLVANSYFAFTNSASLILGFAAAGPLSSAFGQGGPFFAGFALLMIAGFATSTLPSLKPLVKHINPYSFQKVWYEFKEGLKHFWENDKLHYPLLGLIGIQIINGMMITIAPAFIQQAIGLNLDTGSLLAVLPLGLGVLVGALSLGYEEKYLSKAQLVWIGYLGTGIVLFLLCFIQHFPNRYLYYVCLVFPMGIFNAHIFAPCHSLLQTHALSHIRGRVYGALYVLLQIVATLPTIIAAVLADRLPVAYIGAFLGVGAIAFALFLVSRTRRISFT